MIDLFEISYAAEKLSSVLLTLRLALDSAEGTIDVEQVKNVLCACQDAADRIQQSIVAFEEQRSLKQ